MKKHSLLAALLALSAPVAAHAGIVWRGDFETGNRSQFNVSPEMVSADRLQVVTNPVIQGKYALRALVKQGDDPINASGNRNELVHEANEKEGDEYYYRVRVMFDPTFPAPNTWQLFTQWHHTGSSGSPPMEMVVRGEQIEFVNNTAGGTQNRYPLMPLNRGVWNDFILHIKWSSNASVGFLEIFHNGEVVLAKKSMATMYAGQGVYFKCGLYRNETIAPDGILYLDDVTQATALSDLLPSNVAPQPPAPTPGTDGGTPAPDAGVTPAPSTGGTDGGATTPSPVTGSTDPLEPGVQGCSAGGGSLGLLGLVSFAGLALRSVRRRRRQA